MIYAKLLNAEERQISNAKGKATDPRISLQNYIVSQEIRVYKSAIRPEVTCGAKTMRMTGSGRRS